MNKLISLLAFTLLIHSYRVSEKDIATVNEDYFKVEVVQNGKVVEPKDGIIILEKKPFIYQLTYYKVTGVDVSNSWGKYYYDYPENENIYECNDPSFFEGCRFVSIKTGAEDKFNEGRDVYVGNGDYQFHWFYDEEMEWHRLDRGVKVEDGIIHGQVTVENIFDLDKRDTRDFSVEEYKYQIENIDQDIYAVFAASHYKSGMEFPEELQRVKFILSFN